MKKVTVNINSRKMLPKFTDEELTQIAERVGLTLDQLKEVHRLAYQTYNYISADLAELNDGKPMKRYVVVECVLDASRIQTTCQRELTSEIKDWLDNRSMKFPLDDVYAAVAAGFPYPLYE